MIGESTGQKQVEREQDRLHELERSARDVAKRERAEMQLRERAEEIEAMMEAMPAVVLIAHDPDCTVISGNRVAQESLRMPKGSNISKSAPDGQQPTHFKVLSCGRELLPYELPVQSAARGIEVRGNEHEVVFDDGERRHFFGNAMPLRDESGHVRGAISAFVDITARVMAEESLREADQRKDEFLAMLAHELRNPLAPILNAISILNRPNLSDEQFEWSKGVIERQVGHLTRLVDDLLDVSRITQGKIILRKENLDLTKMVRRALETSRPLIDARKHQLTVSLPSETVRLRGDIMRLAQVLSNLLNNAAKYTDEGGAIWLTAEHVGDDVVLRVKDNGMGIPVEELPYVFDLFIQAGRSLDRAQGGLGIGLTLARSIVELHGGRIEALSEGPGQGSEFVIYLPLLELQPFLGDALRNVHGSYMGVEAAAPALSICRRVLVVDDNADSAESLALALTLEGYDAKLAYDGPGAVELASAFQPQVALLDIGLPGMSGYELARQLRRRPGGSEMALIALTGYGQADDRRKSREAGFDHHLTKPVNYDTLVALINSLILK
ncbi:MAG TPA: ATP-binding protein [Blastocatellia bacterium]|nr:ATP-binding protein [Blastocatellia bacterium]